MSERITTTAQGRLSGFDKRRETTARKRYIDEVLGDAGVTDFSLEARRKLEDLSEYDAYMARFSRDQRDPSDRHVDDIDSGKVESREDKQAKNDSRLRRIARLALSVEQMAADGSGDKIADKNGKTVLDYRIDKLRKLQEAYAASDINHEETPILEELPTTTNEDEKSVETPHIPRSEPTQERPTNVPETHIADVSSPEHGDHNDPYEVGSEVIVRSNAFNKDSGEIDPSVPPALFKATIVDISDDGKHFTVKSDEHNFSADVTRDSLDSWQTARIKEYEHKSDGSIDRSKPARWSEWTITEGPDDDGWVRLKNGDKTIVRHRASLELWSKVSANEKVSDSTSQPAQTAEITPDSVKQAEEFINGIPGIKQAEDFISGMPDAKSSGSTAKHSKHTPDTYRIKNKLHKSAINGVEGFTGIRGLTNKYERGIDKVQRALTREKAAVATQAKTDRESAKRALRERLGGSKAVERYADSTLGKFDRKAILMVGRALGRDKTPRQRYNKTAKKFGKNIKQQQKRNK